MKIAARIFNLNVRSSRLVAALKGENGYMSLAEAPVSSDGYFEMVLPNIVLGYSYLSSPKNSCEEMSVHPESLKIGVIDDFWLVDSNETIIGHVFQGSAPESSTGALGGKIVSRWYANQYGEINGSASCSPHGSPVYFKLSLKKGWNDVIRHFRSDAQESIYSCKNTKRLNWFMTLSENSN